MIISLILLYMLVNMVHVSYMLLRAFLMSDLMAKIYGHNVPPKYHVKVTLGLIFLAPLFWLPIRFYYKLMPRTKYAEKFVKHRAVVREMNNASNAD